MAILQTTTHYVSRENPLNTNWNQTVRIHLAWSVALKCRVAKLVQYAHTFYLVANKQIINEIMSCHLAFMHLNFAT